MDNKFTLKPENMKKFVDVLSLLSLTCSEIIVKDNKIKQGSDDRTMILDINLSEISKYDDVSQNINTVLLNLKNEVEILQLFVNDDEVQFKEKNKHMSVITNGFTYSYMSPSMEEVSINFLETLPFDVDSYHKLVSFNVNEINVDRINKLAKFMKTENISVKFNGANVSLVIESNNNIKTSVININDIGEENLDWKDRYVQDKFFYIPIFPFIAEMGTYINITIYTVESKESVFSVIQFTYPGKFKDNFSIYSKSKFLELKKNKEENEVLEKDIV